MRTVLRHRFVPQISALRDQNVEWTPIANQDLNVKVIGVCKHPNAEWILIARVT